MKSETAASRMAAWALALRGRPGRGSGRLASFSIEDARLLTRTSFAESARNSPSLLGAHPTGPPSPCDRRYKTVSYRFPACQGHLQASMKKSTKIVFSLVVSTVRAPQVVDPNAR
jgi:hypothetical protein